MDESELNQMLTDLVGTAIQPVVADASGEWADVIAECRERIDAGVAQAIATESMPAALELLHALLSRAAHDHFMHLLETVYPHLMVSEN